MSELDKLKSETLTVNKYALYTVLNALLSQKHRKFTGVGGSGHLLTTMFKTPVSEKKAKIQEIRQFFHKVQKLERDKREGGEMNRLPQQRLTVEGKEGCEEC